MLESQHIFILHLARAHIALTLSAFLLISTLTKIKASIAWEMFKARLDGALGNLNEWKVSMPTAGEVELDDHSGPFQL